MSQDLEPYLRLVPDLPTWVDLRGLLRSGRCRVASEPDPARGFVARSMDFPFASVWGEPSPEVLQGFLATARVGSDFLLLLEPQRVEAMLGAMPGWRRGEEAILHRWAAQTPLTGRPTGAEVVVVGVQGAGLDLAEVPEEVQREVALALAQRQPMAVALAAGRPVSFCYAPWETESLWDVAVNTLEPYRRRGYAAAAFEALRRPLAERGLSPVWGAFDSNQPSRRLAARLGFVEAARLATLVPPAPR